MTSQSPPTTYPSPDYSPESWIETPTTGITSQEVLNLIDENAVQYPTAQGIVTFPNITRMYRIETTTPNSEFFDVGSNAEYVQLGSPLFSNLNLGGGEIGSFVNINSRLVANVFATPTVASSVDLFGNMITGVVNFAISCTSNLNIGSPSSTVKVGGTLEANTFTKKSGTSDVSMFAASSHNYGINLMTKTTDSLDNGILKIGHANTNIQFRAGTVSSNQTIPSDSNNTTVATTNFVQNTVSSNVANVVAVILEGDNTYTGTNSYGTINITTLNPTNLSQLPIITASPTSVIGGTVSTKIGSLWDSSNQPISFPGGGTTNLVYYQVTGVPAGIYSAGLYYTIPGANSYSRFKIVACAQVQTLNGPLVGSVTEYTALINTFTGNSFVENSMSSSILVTADKPNIAVNIISNSEAGTRYLRLTMLRMG